MALACDRAVAHLARPLPACAVLDPACGDGAFLRAIRARARPGLLEGVDADPVAVRAARAAVPDAVVHHDDALTRAFPRRYDLVLGNPPYVRHQQLHDPLGRPGPYAERVAAAVTRIAPDIRLARRADLAAAFLLLGVSLLADDGVLAFVTTSAWLDAAYGAPLGRWLVDHGLIELVERPSERTFAGAAVNSLIVVARRGEAGPVTLRQLGRSVRSIGRAELRATPKWGGRLLRAPAAASLLSGGVALGDACRVGSYLITGCDRFFYRRTADGIDPACLRPAVKSTRGEGRIVLSGPPRRLLVTAADPRLLGSEAARAEADGLPGLSGVRGRRVWSAIEQEPGAVLCVRTQRDRHIAYLNPEGWASGEFYRVWPPAGVSAAALAAFLNSSVAGLQLEALGRAYGGGGGPLKVERADLVQLRLPAAARLREAAADLEAALAPLVRREIGSVAEERGLPDRAALELLCATLAGADADAVRDAHVAAVTARVRRARRVLRT